MNFRKLQDGDVVLDSTGQGGIIYRVNDYAYVAPASEETASQRHIMRIERLYRDSDGQTFARGTWCYRPEETFHLATRKFCENVCVVSLRLEISARGSNSIFN